MHELKYLTLRHTPNKKTRGRMDHFERAASLENLLQNRPSLAAAMLDSWKTNNNGLGHDRKSSSQSLNPLRPGTSIKSLSNSTMTINNVRQVTSVDTKENSADTPKPKLTRKCNLRRRLSKSRCSTTLLRCRSENAVNQLKCDKTTALSQGVPGASREKDLPGKLNHVINRTRRWSQTYEREIQIEELPFYCDNSYNSKYSTKSTIPIMTRIKDGILNRVKRNARDTTKFSTEVGQVVNKKFRRAQSVMTLNSMSPSNDCIQLDRLLKSRDFLRGFRKFLRREYSEENLDFWLKCEDYKSEKVSKRFKRAGQIYDKFLRPGSFNEVNVCAETRTEVEKSLVRPSEEIFIKAQNQIYHLMLTDSFPRFMEAKWSQKV